MQNMHKCRSLVKAMLITTTTDYILAVYGLDLLDSSDNDAAMQKNVLIKSKDEILH